MSLEGKELGRYRLIRLIGAGGMGEVYLAEDTQVRRQVAAKVIKIEETQNGDESALRLFLREATAIAQLDHPNILPLYDHGQEKHDSFHYAYLITPYRSEGSLINWLRQRGQKQATQQLTAQQIVYIIQQAADALQYAHDHQIIHQDVKPANFLIRSSGEAEDYPHLLLADFGIALLVSATSHSSQHLRGTPIYMAPEQWANKTVFASDQYSLAIMTYELLTGKPPFQGSPMSMMYAHAHEQPKPVSELNPQIPQAVDRVLLRALSKTPEERYPSIRGFAQELRGAFQEIEAATSLRLLQPALPTPGGSGNPLTPLPQSANDLRTSLAISPEEARTGSQRVLALPGGRTAQVQIPAGARSGQILTLAGLGDVTGTGVAGNLYLTLAIVGEQTPNPTPSTGDDLTYLNQQAAHPHPLTPLPGTFSPATGPGQALPTQQTAPTNPASSPGLQQVSSPQYGQIARQNTSSPQYGQVSGVPVSSSQPPVSSPGYLPIQQVNNPPSLPGYLPAQQVNNPPSSPGYLPTQQVNPPSQEHMPTRLASQSSSGHMPTQHANPPSQGHMPTVMSTHVPEGMFVAPPQAASRSRGNRGLIAIIIVLLVILLGGGGLAAYYAANRSSSSGSISSSGSSGLNHQATSTAVTTATAGATASAVASSATATAGAATATVGTSATSTPPSTTGNPSGITIALHAITPVTQNPLHAITWSGSRFVAVGEHGTILTSTDGKNWADVSGSSGTQQNLNGVAWKGSRFVAVGDNATLLTSPDGQNWTTVTLNSVFQNLNAVGASSSLAVVGGDGGTLLYSSDGQNWSPAATDISYNIRAVRWTGSMFLAAGYNGRIYTSPDGNNWNDHSLSGSPASLPNLEAVRQGAGFVAVGDNGTLAWSSDASQWSLQHSGTSQTLHAITWNGSVYLTVGDRGTVLASTNGRNWSAQNVNTQQDLLAVASSGSQFVAVGKNGTILTT